MNAYKGVYKMKPYSKQVTIKYSDLDSAGFLSLRALMGYLQDVAGSHSSSVGYGYDNIPDTHVTWLLLDWKVDMLMQPEYNSQLTIYTWPRVLEKFYSYREFEVYDSNKNLVAVASSKWILYNVETKKVARITDDIINSFGIHEKSVFEKPMNERPKEPQESTLNFKYKIQRRDIDTNQHVNNLNYIDFAMEALPEEVFQNNEFTKIEIHYKKEIHYKDKIHCYYSFRNNKHVITIKNEDDSVIHAIVKLY